jgi:hypothetical protein
VVLVGLILWRFVFNKEEEAPEPQPQPAPTTPVEPVQTSIPEVPAVEDSKREVSGLTDLVNGLEFVESKDNEIVGNVILTLSEGHVKVNITPEGEATTPIESEIENLTDVVAIEAVKMADSDGTIVVYALDSSKSLYRAKFASNVTEMQPVVLERYMVTDIESITAHGTNLDDSTDVNPFVLIKTTDGRYFTDSRFSDDAVEILREIVN